MISVTMVDAGVYEVTVEKPVETCHRVSMSQDYYRHLCGGKVTHEWLIIQAFRFLLDREPNTAILASFDLSDINGYFPEFEEELALKLA